MSITLSSFRSLALGDGHRVYHIVVVSFFDSRGWTAEPVHHIVVTRFACISVSPQAVYYEH